MNRWPGWLYPILWPFMQLGNLVVGTAAGLLAAWWAGELDVAVGVVLAMILKLVVERALRRRLTGQLTARVRPGTSQPGAILRGGDVPHGGPSFPSGHVILAAAIGCTVGPVVPVFVTPLVLALPLVVMIGRVYVGAHNPLDVTAGLGAGLMLGGLVAWVVG
jgi:undecaprenyl-diphosphatase